MGSNLGWGGDGVSRAVKALTLALAMLVAATASADAVKVKGDPQYQQWADESLVATPSFRVYARNRSCPFIQPPPGKVAACARRFTVWVELGYSGSQWRFLHELGHVIHRQFFKSRWWDSELFAEQFAQCGVYGPNVPWVFPVPVGWCERLDGLIRRNRKVVGR